MRDRRGTASDTIDAIDADIDVLKEEIQAMRQETERYRTEPKSQADLRTDIYLSQRRHRSRNSTAVPPKMEQPESAAARLQKQHEQSAQERSPTEVCEARPSPPKPCDFPPLQASSDSEATSFASADGCDSVVVSPVSANTDLSINEHYVTAEGSSSKQSPHFAQPTKAFARRADVTVRRDSISAGSKNTANGSPSKSGRTLTERALKRKSLPVGWMDDTEGPAARDVTAGARSIKIGSRLEASPSPEQVKDKKVSSFMSPTKATTRRNMATLGKGSVQHLSPRIRKSASRMDPGLSPTKSSGGRGIATSPVSPSMTTSDSEQIITECRAQIVLRDEHAALDKGTMTDRVIPDDLPARPSRRCIAKPAAPAPKLAPRTKAAVLPSVANTTVQRRSSRGHLLLPIKTKLDKHGLLIDTASPHDRENGVPRASTLTTTLHAIREKLPGAPGAHVQTKSTPIDADLSHRPECLPPHVSAQLRKASGKTAASSTLSGATTNPRSLLAQTPSLRATAQEFRPTFKPQAAEEIYGPSWSGSIPWLPEDEWNALPLNARAVITNLRHQNRNATRVCTASTVLPHSPPDKSASKAANERFWNDLLSRSMSMTRFPAQNSSGEVDTLKPSGPEPDQRETVGSCQQAQAHAYPDRHRWTVGVVNNGNEALRYDRATLQPAYSPCTPHISPTSDDTSPRYTPEYSPRGWTIGALRSSNIYGNTYGWKGGDGKEIKFTGWGPDAERDPNHPVNFNFHGHVSSLGRASRGHMDDSDLPDPPLAPRSRAQWAQMAGYTKVPCGDVEVTHATENLVGSTPFAQQVAGYCFDCTAPRLR